MFEKLVAVQYCLIEGDSEMTTKELSDINEASQILPTAVCVTCFASFEDL